MAKTGRIAILPGAREKFEIKEFELPTPEPGTMLVKTEMTGVCATDVHYWMGYSATYDFHYPALYGHEFCARIEELGEGMETDYLGRPIHVGDRVVFKPMQQCGKCYWCQHGVPMKCTDAKSYGDMPWEDKKFTGAFAEYVYIHVPKSEFFRTDLDPKIACLLEPLSIAVNGIECGQQRIGDVVVVQGAGPIGMLTAGCAKYYGASKVIMVAAPANRLEVAKTMGVDVTINIEEVTDPEERIKMIMDLTDGRGADVVYECAGFPSAFEEGLKYVRFGGNFSEIGHFSDTGNATVNPAFDFCSKCINLRGGWASSTRHFVQALAIMESRRFPIENLITHTVSLDEIDIAFDCIANKNYVMPDGTVAIKIAVDPWKYNK